MLRFPNAGDRESPGVTGTQAAWTCPSCQRTVPARVDDCYCGTDRETADRFRARELGARRGGPSWSAIGLALAAAVVVALGFLGSDAPLEPEPTPTVVAPPEPSALVQERTPPTPRPRGRRWRDPEPPVPTPVLTSIPTAAPEPIEEPSPEPTPEPTPDEHSLDVRRVEGRGDFEAALSALEPEVLIVNRKLRIYRGRLPHFDRPGAAGRLRRARGRDPPAARRHRPLRGRGRGGGAALMGPAGHTARHPAQARARPGPPWPDAERDRIGSALALNAGSGPSLRWRTLGPARCSPWSCLRGTW